MQYINERDSALPTNNKVIGYHDGMAILEVSGSNELFYDTMDYSCVTLGEHLVDAQPKPIALLPAKMQRAIKGAIIWESS